MLGLACGGEPSSRYGRVARGGLGRVVGRRSRPETRGGRCIVRGERPPDVATRDGATCCYRYQDRRCRRFQCSPRHFGRGGYTRYCGPVPYYPYTASYLKRTGGDVASWLSASCVAGRDPTGSLSMEIRGPATTSVSRGHSERDSSQDSLTSHAVAVNGSSRRGPSPLRIKPVRRGQGGK